MVITHITTRSIPPNPDDGGMPYIIHSTAIQQIKEGHSVSVVSMSPPKSQSKSIYNVIYPKLYDSQNLLKAIPSNTDIIHLHEINDPSQAFAIKNHYPTVNSIYGNSGHLEDVTGNKIFTSSSHARRHGCNVYVYNGVNLQDYPMSQNPKNQLIFLGKVRRSKKGAATAISVSKKTKVPLILAGGKKFNIPSSWLPFNSYIKPVGVVDGRVKVDMLRNSLALLFPIRWQEPFGMVQLEALACGTPIISFNMGAAQEIVEHGKNGFIVDDLEGMCEAVNKIDLIDRNECRRSVMKNFAIEQTSQKLSAYYRAATAGEKWK